MANTPPRTRRRGLASTLLFAALALVLALMAVIYIQDQQESDPEIVPPTTTPGQAEVRDIVAALEVAGLDAATAPGGVRSPTLAVPGQALTVEGELLYVFVYREQADREAASETLRPERVLPPRNSAGTPLPAAETRVAAGSNVIVAMSGGADEVWETVEQAITELP